MIRFNRPFLTGQEIDNIKQAVRNGHISGNGDFTKMCHQFFEKKYNFLKVLLTTSCTDALEMSAMLFDIKPGDEVIVPSYTFVSSALAYIRQGARVRFVDSRSDHPGMDEEKIEELITPNTKAIVVVHYAGIACDMDKIMSIAKKYNLFVIEDAAQAIDSYYKKKPLGGIGHLGCFSFHETKNIQSGEGGLLAINETQFINRSEIIWEKGTNRAEFFRGEVNKYGWVDIGSSFLPSDLIAAFLSAQLDKLDQIQASRKIIWETYYKNLINLMNEGFINLPATPLYATNNYHMFYFVCKDSTKRDDLINYLKSKGIYSVFHYLPLHKSSFYKSKHDSRILKNSEYYANNLIRLPFYIGLTINDITNICYEIYKYFKNYK